MYTYLSLSKRDLLLVAAGAVGASIIGYSYYIIGLKANKCTQNKSKLLKRSSASTKIKDGKTSGTYLIPASVLRDFTSKVLVKCGCYKVEADKAAEILILADERGIDSHGCARLMAYFSMLKNKS